MLERRVVVIAATLVTVSLFLPESTQGSNVHRTFFSYSAQRGKAGAWNFMVKTSGNPPRQTNSQMAVDVELSETADSRNATEGGWTEMTALARVQTDGRLNAVDWLSKGLLNRMETSPSPLKQSCNKTTTFRVPPDYMDIASLGYYKVHRSRARWEAARRRCTREGAHLLIVNSAVEAAAVVATSGLRDWSWVGFDDFSDEEEYVTLHGTTLDEAGYSAWADEEPTSGLRCGVVDAVGLLGTGECNLEREFICELHRPGEHGQEARPPGLPAGYRPVGGLGYYRVHRDRAKWEAARRRCLAEGAHLFVPNSEVEAAAVLRPGALPGWLWVGFDDFDRHRQYVNFDGERLNSPGVYSKFAPDEPDSRLRCGAAQSDGLLGTGTCEHGKQYVCELYKYGQKPEHPKPSPTPPSGYVALGNTSLYKVHRDRAPWETARRRCQGEGAHLVVINSQAEADAVLATSGLPGWFWVGFDDFEAEGEFVTVQGTRLVDTGYVRWAEDEPTEDLNCGVAKTNGLLGTGTCKFEREYICEWEKPSAIPQPPYRGGYRKIGDLGYYKVHRDRAPWETARRRCQAEGAQLVVVNSQAEADAVLGSSGLPGWFWVGFDDFDTAGQYVTLHGTTLQEAGYEKWADGEPYENVNCGLAKTDGLLGTGNCYANREYICELNTI